MHSGSPGQQVWKRFRKNKSALGGLTLIVLSVFVSLFCYVFIPDHTPDSNRMCLPAGNQPPGFSVNMIRVRKAQAAPPVSWMARLFTGSPDPYEEIAIRDVRVENVDILYEEFENGGSLTLPVRKLPLEYALYSIRSDSKPVEAGGFVSFVDIDGNPRRVSVTDMKDDFLRSKVVRRTYWLGTDRYGRDLLSRLLAGTRITMSVGLVAVIISLIVGLFFGSLAGFFKGWVDQMVLWLINVTWSIPTLLLVIAITLVLGKGFEQVFIAVGLTMWVDVARIVRGQLFSVRELEFISAGRAMGYGTGRLILKHMLPNILGPVLVVAASNFSTAILLESGLSFLGIGAQPPTPSWGTMIKENYGYIIIPGSAYLAVLPGLAIMVLTMAFTIVANGLRDAMDSRRQVTLS